MQQIFLTSDYHFSHKNVITYCNRPFADVKEMNEFLVKQWNETVGPEDYVCFLGDFALDFRVVREILPQLNGQIGLYAGNHDSWHPMHKKWQRFKDELLEFPNVESVQIEGEFPVADIFHMTMSHFPSLGTEGDTDHGLKYAEWRPKTDWWHIHGHVHERWKVRGKNINVSWDAWHRLLTMDDIIDIYLGEHKEIAND